MLSKIEIGQIQDLTQMGVSQREIARRVQVSRAAVRKYAHATMEEIQEERRNNKKKSQFDAYKDKIRAYWLQFDGNSGEVRRQLEKDLNRTVNVRTIRKYCE